MSVGELVITPKADVFFFTLAWAGPFKRGAFSKFLVQNSKNPSGKDYPPPAGPAQAKFRLPDSTEII